MSQSEPLSQMLGQLRAEGSLDSSGRFTLSLRQALEKLRQFQLPEPHRYILNLVASAVAGGASWLQVDTQATHTAVSYDGTPPTLLQRRELFIALFSSQAGDAAWRELAVGLHGARSLDPAWIQLDAWSAGTGSSLRIAGDTLTVSPLSVYPWKEAEPAIHKTRIQVHERVGIRTASKIFQSLSGKVGPEAEVILGSCRQAPVDLILNGLKIPHPHSLGRCHHVLEWSQPSRAPAYTCSGYPSILRESPPFAGWGVLARAGGTSNSAHVLVILNGISFSMSLPRRDSRIRGIVWVEHLSKDLSQSALVEDEAYLELRGLLDTAAQRLERLFV